MAGEGLESHRKIVIIYLLTKRLHIRAPFLSLPLLCASLPRRDSGVGRYSRSALPSCPSQATLVSQRTGGFWTALASCCSYRSLGAAVLPLWEVCCAVHLELPLPMVVPTAGAPCNGKVLPATLDTPTNDTIKAFERRVWRCTTTEKFSLQAA